MHRSNSRVSHAQVRALAGWRSGVCRSPHPQLGSAPFLPSSPAAPTARHACSYLVDLVGDPLECLALLHEIEHLLALGGRLHAGHALAAAARTGEARRRRHTRHTSRGVARGAGKGPSAHAQAAGEVAGAECRHGGGRAAAAWRGVVAQQPARWVKTRAPPTKGVEEGPACLPPSAPAPMPPHRAPHRTCSKSVSCRTARSQAPPAQPWAPRAQGEGPAQRQPAGARAGAPGQAPAPAPAPTPALALALPPAPALAQALALALAQRGRCPP